MKRRPVYYTSLALLILWICFWIGIEVIPDMLIEPKPYFVGELGMVYPEAGLRGPHGLYVIVLIFSAIFWFAVQWRVHAVSTMNYSRVIYPIWESMMVIVISAFLFLLQQIMGCGTDIGAGGQMGGIEYDASFARFMILADYKWIVLGAAFFAGLYTVVVAKAVVKENLSPENSASAT